MRSHAKRSVLALAACLAACGLANAQNQNRPAPDLAKQPTLYVVGYAHLDTEWRWEYPQVIDEYLKDTLLRNFGLFEKYPHYVFNFSGSNRYRFFKEYYPAEFATLKKYVAAGRWFPAGSSVEEGDVNAPNAEGIIRQILYGNNWFRKELGKASAEYMLPDCFGFPASLPSILAHAGVKGFSTQKLTWGSSVPAGGPDSIERTPAGIPFNVGVWVGPDGRSVVAALNPGDYDGPLTTDLSQPLPPAAPMPGLDDAAAKLPQAARQAIDRWQRDRQFNRDQDDWALRVERNGKASGVFADYHYYGTGDIGGAPDENSVKTLEAIVTRAGGMGEGPLHAISAPADQMFLDLTPAEIAGLPRFTGEMELTNHSAGSLTSQAYVKRWLRRQETLADAAEKASLAADWLGGRKYPLERLNNAWTLAMGTHFHDIAAGTATPRSYEFAWNDQVISLNQFAGVFTSATEAVAAALNTQTAGVPVVVFNPLNISREDIVEAKIDLPAGTKAVRVVGPDGTAVPAQLSGGKVLFLATVPSVGYKVYEVAPAAAAVGAGLRVSASSLENGRYRVTLDANGDISSIFDKSLQRELLSGPARLAITYDNPAQYPAWNMDWEQASAAPRSYVSGPAKVRVVENGPVRVAVEVARETEGSRFVQTVSLAAGDPGSRVEIANAIDWNTREASLKAAFPLTASNQLATYNLDIGTIERPTNQPRKFEFPSHQWVDLTDATGAFGVTLLTDCKNGSDKPRDNVLRLTLLRTPGTRAGYHDQGTQDVGHHEFVYGIAGHAGGWRGAKTDWQGYRLNQPLVAFETARHQGALGKEFSLLRSSNPDIRVLAMKKAEQSDEVIVRLVETLGHPADNVRVAFAAPVVAAREVNGQEQPVGPASIAAGALEASFTAYQPRTFAVRLSPAPRTLPAPVQSKPVTLAYDLAVATADGAKSSPGFDAQGRALPAPMLPGEIDFGGVVFKLAPATGANAAVAKGQSIDLPEGAFNRVWVLAASSDGDRKATFRVGASTAEVTVEDWGGFIGQWDNRVWKQVGKDPYGEMVKVVPGYIKRADVAWYCSHRHTAAGANETYSYSYLFAYPLDLPAGAKTLTLPDDDKIRVMAVSVAREAPAVRAVQPLYDTVER